MEVVYLVVNGVGLVLDVLILVLDFNFLLVFFFLVFLVWFLVFVYNLLYMVLISFLYLGCGVLFLLLVLIEVVVWFVCGGLQVLCILFYSCCFGLESLKFLGYLVFYGVLWSREILYWGVFSVVFNGYVLLCQVCDICVIVMSLVVYVINSLVNICFISIQNFFFLVLVLWDIVIGFLWRMMDVVVVFLVYIFSSVVVMVIFFWIFC